MSLKRVVIIKLRSIYIIININLMISYGVPLCALSHYSHQNFFVTHSTATNLLSPARLEELMEHKDTLSGKINFWERIFPDIQRSFERQLQPSDLAIL
jgi:hypothetical protein